MLSHLQPLLLILAQRALIALGGQVVELGRQFKQHDFGRPAYHLHAAKHHGAGHGVECHDRLLCREDRTSVALIDDGELPSQFGVEGAGAFQVIPSIAWLFGCIDGVDEACR